MEQKLADIASIQFGIYEKPAESGPILYLQARHFTEKGMFVQQMVDSFLPEQPEFAKHLLKDGDVLLVGKGNRIFAWCYHADIGSAVASTIFFVIRVHPNRVFPDYLATYLNLPACQAFFQQLGAGSSILSIRKNELAALPVTVPSLDIQHHIVALQNLHEREMVLLDTLVQRKQALFQATIYQLLNQ